MKFIQGHSRNQINLFPVSLDQSIDPDNEVRIIDLFVDSLSIKDYGFRMDYIETTVRQWGIWFKGQRAYSVPMNSLFCMTKVTIQVQS